MSLTSTVWNTLNTNTKNFANATNVTNLPAPSSGTVANEDITYVYVGLKDDLSTIMTALTSANKKDYTNVVISVDTLSMSEANYTFPSNFVDVLIIARQLEISTVNSVNLLLGSTAGSTNLSVLTTGTSGGVLSLGSNVVSISSIEFSTDSPKYYIPSPQIYSLVDGKSETSAFTIPDFFNSAISLNSLQASFQAASMLVNTSDKNQVAAAFQMLNWVNATAAACAADSSLISKYPSGWTNTPNNLQIQSAGLLPLAAAKSNATNYVPTLSEDFYSDTIVNTLLPIAEAYNAEYQESQNSKTQDEFLQDFASALSTNASNNASSLGIQLQNLINNYKSIIGDTTVLSAYIKQQQSALTSNLTQLRTDQTKETFWGVFKQIIGNISTALTFAETIGDLAAATEDPETLEEAIGNIIKIVDDISKDMDAITSDEGAGGTYSNEFITGSPLMNNVAGICSAFTTGGSLVANISASADPSSFSINASDLPDYNALNANGISLSTYWQTWGIPLQNTLQSIENDENSSSDVKQDATNALNTLNLLIQYGTAYANKLQTLLQLQGEIVGLVSQIQVANSASENYDKIAKVISDQEQKEAAQMAYATQMYNNIQRNILLAVDKYNAAYYYFNLLEPTATQNITLSMSYTDLSNIAQEIAENYEAQLTRTIAPNEDTVEKMIHPRQDLTNFLVKLPATIQSSDHTMESVFSYDGNTDEIYFVLSQNLLNDLNILALNDKALYLTQIYFYLEGATTLTSNVNLTISAGPNYAQHKGTETILFNGTGYDLDVIYNPDSFKNDIKKGGTLSGDQLSEAESSPWAMSNLVKVDYSYPSLFTNWSIKANSGTNISDVKEIYMWISCNYLDNAS